MSAANRRPDIGSIEVVFLALTLLLAGIHFYLALIDPATSGEQSGQFLLIGVAFLAGFLARLTPYWRPVLYLLGAAFALYLGVLWLLGGTEHLVLGVVTGATATVFIVLAIYLFIREESRAVNT